MGIVHDHKRPALGADRLHATRRRRHPRKRLEGCLGRHLEREQRREHRQQVVDVEIPDQRRLDHPRQGAISPGRHLDLEGESARRAAYGRRRQQFRPGIERQAARGGGAPGGGATSEPGAAATGLIRGERGAETIVDVEHTISETRHVEQARLRRTIGLEGTVVIEMVAGEVGKHRRTEPHGGGAMLVERM